MKLLPAVLLVACCYGASAQYGDGPVPARLQIPGAIALGPKPGAFRQGRVIQAPPANAVRVRRPGPAPQRAFKSAAPAPFLQQLEESPKPVTEEPDDVPDNLSTPGPFGVSPFPPPQQLSPEDLPHFFGASGPAPKPLSIPGAAPAAQAPPPRLPEPVRIAASPRPPPQHAPPSAPARFEAPVRQQQPARVAPLSYRPARPQFRPEPRPLDDEEEEPVRQVFRQPARPQQQQVQAQAPKYAPSTRENSRERKPVAQVIRKYRDDNPDGSITWGFENDDGSFKEETIGVDCVTRGRYGYVDPDGLKREYSYETGILCDKAKEEQQEQGFVDYQENKAVLPNGIVLDLANMGKKSRRPQRHSQ